MSRIPNAGVFTHGISSRDYQLPHRRIGFPVILLIRRVLSHAIQILRGEAFQFADKTEDEITAALRGVIENNLRQSGEVPGFNRRTYEWVGRQSQFENFNGSSLNKEPDLFFKLRCDELESYAGISEFDGLFVECKPVDRSHPAGSPAVRSAEYNLTYQYCCVKIQRNNTDRSCEMVFNPWLITRAMFLEEEEVAALLAWLAGRVAEAPADDPGPRVDELIVQSLLFSGLRNSEFCRLTLADTMIGTGKSVFHVRGKPSEERTVHVPQAVSDLVRRFVNEVRPGCLPDGASPRDYSLPLVFNERGKPYERTGLYRRVVRILSDAGLASRASVQLLRHTYGYLAYKRSGGNLLFVQRQLGHAHPQVTSIYAEFVDERYDQLADVVGTAKVEEQPQSKAVPSRSKTAGTTKQPRIKHK